MSTVSSSSSSSSLSLSGLASGLDWKSLISQLADVERSRENVLYSEQNDLDKQNSALSTIKTELTSLQTLVTKLKDPTFFDTRTATASDSTVASATVTTSANVGTYSFDITQLATAAVLQGNAGAGGNLSATSDVSGLSLTSAPFATQANTGTFTVSGKQITVESTDTLQNVFDKISSATEGAVSASYDPDSDTISLTGSSEIVLGSATDTSNFLQVAKLANNGSGAVTSSGKLGAVRVIGTIAQSNLANGISDGGAGEGVFRINGVDIHFSATGDSFSNVIDRINSSAANVTASYDAINNRFALTNKTTGDVGVAVEDVTGNFMAATGLMGDGAALAHGKNLLYTVNNGSQLSSQTNTITSASSGIAGLSVSVLSKDTFSVTVGSDTTKIKSTITSFITQYNKVQSVINAQTASSTSAAGKVTSGVLSGDQDTETLNSTLRNLVNDSVSGLSGTLKSLTDLGFTSNGTND